MRRTKDGVGRVHSDLILGSVADQPFSISEGHIRRRRSVTLIIGYDLNTIMLPHSNTRVCCTEINSDRRSFSFSGHSSLSDQTPAKKLEQIHRKARENFKVAKPRSFFLPFKAEQGDCSNEGGAVEGFIKRGSTVRERSPIFALQFN